MIRPRSELARVGIVAALIIVGAFVFSNQITRAQDRPAAANSIVKLKLSDTIQPISAGLLSRTIDHADQVHASVVLIELDTPGGLLDSTREMVERIEHSQAPVIIFVSPSGAHAASAGFFLLESADVAAMEEGTNTGAAHPVLQGSTPDPIMKDKMENDAAAFLRSYVTVRKRNAEIAESAVRQSKAFSADEALSLKLVDVVAKDEADLLRQLEGRTITRFDGRQQALHLAGAAMEEIRPTLREGILDRFMDPNLALLMLVLGGLLIYLEFNVPGTVVPGAIGTLLMLLALFSFNLLPVRYASAALLVGGLLLIVAEAKFPSHGFLTLAGAAALVFGAMTLIDGPIPQLRVSLWTSLAAGLSFGGITFVLASLALRARRAKARTGMEAMIGEIAEARTGLHPEGTVFVHGELWSARCVAGADKGAQVKIIGSDGLLLIAEPFAPR